jgi:hypothetical protein
VIVTEVMPASGRVNVSAPAWDFFIDDVSFTATATTVSECKNGGWEAFGIFSISSL